MINNRKKTNGFTLIELLIAITILAIIATIGLTTYANAQIVGRDARRRQDLRSLAQALEVYYQDHNPHAYPTATSVSALGTPLVPNYINQIPDPPSSNPVYAYTYNGGGAAFELCVGVENPSTPIRDGVNTTQGSVCPAGAPLFLHITNP